VGATAGQVPEMMRNLLIERFHLEARPTSEEMAAYRLVVARSGVHVQGNRARQFRSAPRSLSRRVVNATGLTGKYDIALHRVEEQPSGVETDGPSLLEALNEQLGLGLTRS
jgi:hypothetical protein